MNWNGFSVTTPPAVEPVTVAELMAELRLDDAQQTSMLERYITAARQAVETSVRRTLITTIYLVRYDRFYARLDLPRPPIQTVASVTYLTATGSDPMTPGTYLTDAVGHSPGVVPAYGYSWPVTIAVPNAVSVAVTCGYGATGASVPAALRQAILALAIDLYEHPEMEMELRTEQNRTVRFLLAAYRLPVVG